MKHTLLLFILLFIPLVSAGTISRSFSSQTLSPNSDLFVTLAVDVDVGETFYVIEEKPPRGWVIKDSGTGAIGVDGKLRWAEIMSAIDTTYTYILTTPAVGVDAVFDGKYMLEGMVEEQTIGGDSEVFVGSITLGSSTETLCNFNGCILTTYADIVRYDVNGELILIDKRIIESGEIPYNYKNTTGIYHTYFNSNPTAGPVVKYVKNDIEVTFQPMALNYRNNLNQLQQVSMINSVIGFPRDNIFIYPAAYGAGIDLKYVYWNTLLKEKLVINSFSDFVAPAQYIVDGGSPTLDLDFILSTNAKQIKNSYSKIRALKRELIKASKGMRNRYR